MENQMNLIPGNEGQFCPGNPTLCDECDYLICCTNCNGLYDRPGITRSLPLFD